MPPLALLLALPGLLGAAASAAAAEPRGSRFEDPLAALDRHLTHTLAQHYLWPWSQLLRAAALDDDSLQEPQIVSDASKFQIDLRVKSFRPEELRVRIKNRYVIVEGQHSVGKEEKLVANHFVQRFALPAGCRAEEVSAVLSAKGVLSVSAPRHEPPPPPPEREVPIVVLLPEEPAREATSQTPLQQLNRTETHGKIRKKELKSTTSDRELKLEGNVLEPAAGEE